MKQIRCSKWIQVSASVLSSAVVAVDSDVLRPQKKTEADESDTKSSQVQTSEICNLTQGNGVFQLPVAVTFWGKHQMILKSKHQLVWEELTVVWRLQPGPSAASLLPPPPWCSKRSGLEPQTSDPGPPRSQSENTSRGFKQNHVFSLSSQNIQWTKMFKPISFQCLLDQSMVQSRPHSAVSFYILGFYSVFLL